PPLASTVSVTLFPCTIDVDEVIELMVTPGQPLTVTVAELLSAEGSHPFETRTQYEVVCAGETLTAAVVPPPTGAAVLPVAPTYHWNVAAASLVMATESVTLCPRLMLFDCGCVTIDGGVQLPPPPPPP